jgi:hypothetical protein
MIAKKADDFLIVGLQSDDIINNFSWRTAPVNIIADKYYCIVFPIGINVRNELFELSQAAVDVAYGKDFTPNLEINLL